MIFAAGLMLVVLFRFGFLHNISNFVQRCSLTRHLTHRDYQVKTRKNLFMLKASRSDLRAEVKKPEFHGNH